MITVQQGKKHTAAREARDREISEARSGSGLTFQAIADKYGLTKQRVIQIAKKMGTGPPPPKPPDHYRANEFSALYKSGKSVAEISAESGMSMRSVYRRLNRAKSIKQLAPLWDRLAARISIASGASGCWMWTGTRTKQGYGNLCSSVKRTNIAHRLVYEALVGPIPEGLHLDHLCREPGCVNPQHLEPVTLAENIRRGVRPTYKYCKRGHERTSTNLHPITRSGRVVAKVCLICRDMAADRRDALRKVRLTAAKTWWSNN